MKLFHVSALDQHHGRYVVGAESPDGGRSTWAECWGRDARYGARAVAASDELAELLPVAERYGMQSRSGFKPATIWDRRTGRPVGAARLAAVGP
jgi:hypothetical protein